MNYNAYLQGEHWKLMRRLRREVDNEQCSVCGSKDRLNVHHKTYERLGAEKLGDLITLCYECHGKYHDKLGKVDFNTKQKSTIETFHKKEEFTAFKIEEDTSILTVVNNTFENYDLLLEGKNWGTIPNQRTIKIEGIPSGLREFNFKSGNKEKKKTEKIKGTLKLDINYSREELDGFLKEVRSTPVNKPLSADCKNILSKYLEIKEFLPVLEEDGYMNYYIQNKELLKFLISKGHHTNSKSKYNQTPLEAWAYTAVDESIYDLLVSYGARPTNKTLELALSKASKRVIGSILSYVDFEPKFVYEVTKNRNEGVLEYLIENEIDFNFKYSSYNYPIHHFISNNRWDIMDKLVEANINMNVLTNQDETPFLLALKKWQNEDRVMELLELGFSPLGEDLSKMTALSYACLYGFNKLVKKLLSDYEFNVNHLNRDGKSPLIYACNKPKLEIIELLLSKGADTSIIGSYKSNGLSNVVLSKNYQAIELLIKHGMDINNIDHPGNTPLFYAVSSGDLDIIKLLLDNGADRTIKTSRNLSEIVSGPNSKKILDLIQ